jgi:hypothetical protein
MSRWLAFKEGVRLVNRNKRMWLLFLLVNLLFASVLVLPVFNLLSDLLSHSLYAEATFKDLDVQMVAEFLYQYQGFPTAWLPLLVAGIVLYLVASTFMAGGVLEVFHSEDARFSLSKFLSGCGKYFPRFLRLLLFSLLFYAAVLGINAGLAALSGKWLENSLSERPVAGLVWLRTAVILFLLCLVNMAFDYAKIKLVVDESKKAMRTTMASIRFLTQNLRATFGLYFTIGLIGVFFLLAYTMLGNTLPSTSAGLVLVGFLLQQIFILSKIWVRLTFFSSQMALYKGLKGTALSSVAEVPFLAGATVDSIAERSTGTTEATASQPALAEEERKETSLEDKETS